MLRRIDKRLPGPKEGEVGIVRVIEGKEGRVEGRGDLRVEGCQAGLLPVGVGLTEKSTDWPRG